MAQRKNQFNQRFPEGLAISAFQKFRSILCTKKSKQRSVIPLFIFLFKWFFINKIISTQIAH